MKLGKNLFTDDITGGLLWPDHDVNLDTPVGFVNQDFTKRPRIDCFVLATEQVESFK